MEKLLSRKFSVQSVPEDYVFPPDKRPGENIIHVSNTIPVIDLENSASNDSDSTIQQILNASQEFGFFQVINHGVCENLMEETMKTMKELFEDEKRNENFKSETHGYDNGNQEGQYWRENIKHPCYPLDECLHLWPQTPTKYKDVVGRYSIEVRKLSMRILELIGEGLGLERGYFVEELSKIQMLSVNHYPTCPNPSLTLGLPKHCDPGLITILLQQNVCGLQVFKDGNWIGVQPLCNAFVVNIGYQLQMISNGKLKSSEHRVITNSTESRTTIVTFINPCKDAIVEPAKPLLDELNPPLYKPFRFIDFITNYTSKFADTETVLDAYKM